MKLSEFEVEGTADPGRQIFRHMRFVSSENLCKAWRKNRFEKSIKVQYLVKCPFFPQTQGGNPIHNYHTSFGPHRGGHFQVQGLNWNQNQVAMELGSEASTDVMAEVKREKKREWPSTS